MQFRVQRTAQVQVTQWYLREDVLKATVSSISVANGMGSDLDSPEELIAENARRMAAAIRMCRVLIPTTF